MFFVIPLFLLCAVLFTLYLVGITVRDARRKVESIANASERKKDEIALKSARPNFVSVTSCSDCEADKCNCNSAEPIVTDLTELRREVT